MTLRGMEGEGDICLTCLSSLTPHCSFDQGYSTIEGAIRQSTKQPIEKMKIEITPKKKLGKKLIHANHCAEFVSIGAGVTMYCPVIQKGNWTLIKS